MVDNLTQELIYAIPPELVGQLSFLITILQAAGIMVILYILFSIINWRINKRKRAELTRINESLEQIKLILEKNTRK